MTALTVRNARLMSGESVDVAITGGIISSIAPASGETGGDEIDANGRWLIPGLWDEHVHTNLWAISRRRLDLTSAGSAAEAVASVGAALQQSADEVFIAVNYRDALWPDRLSVAALDAVSGERPVLLISGDVHATWLNSAALRRFNVGSHQDGRIAEDEAFRVQQQANILPDGTLDVWVAEALRDASARGVVGIVDFEMRDTARDWIRRSAAGQLQLRVESSVYPQHLESAIAEGRSTGRALDELGLARAGYFKVITDGSLGTRTAWCSHAYPDGSFGAANVDYAVLTEQVRLAHSAHIVPAIHAIGDRAVHEVFNVFERVGCAGRMEHAQQVGLADISRFAELGVIASVQPEHAMDDRDAAERLWRDALDGAYLLRSLREAGATLAFGSDAPVAALDPWFAIASAVWRTRYGREPWRREEALSIEEAIAASTRHVPIQVGSPADLVLLDADPTASSAEQLREMPVALTMVGGERVFDAR